MPTETAQAPTLTSDGHPIAPGETITPFPEDHPTYTLMYAGVLDGRVHMTERHNGRVRAFSIPLADITGA